jgi:hypothetical protein
MKRNLLLLICFLALATCLSAQTKITGTLDCDKADPMHTIQVPDQNGFSYAIAQYKCTWPKPLVIDGLHSTKNTDVEFYEITDKSQRFLSTAITYYDNGDKVFSRGTGLIPLKSLNSSGKWTYTGGTGKFKGIKGGGTSECKSKSSESTAGYTCEIVSEHTLPAAKK